MTVSVVTGSSTGIGAATAVRLAGLGHTVFWTVRSEASGAVPFASIACSSMHAA